MKKESNLKEYNELIESLDNKFFGKTYSIFYNIIMKSFLNDIYIYYRLYITNVVLGNNWQNKIDSEILFAHFYVSRKRNYVVWEDCVESDCSFNLLEI